MCVVRWEVYWDRRGVVIYPIATLDTLSSHILSLTSTILINREPPPNYHLQHVYLNSPSSHTRNDAAHTGTNKSPVKSPRIRLDPIITYTQMLVASTNVGMYKPTSIFMIIFYIIFFMYE